MPPLVVERKFKREFHSVTCGGGEIGGGTADGIVAAVAGAPEVIDEIVLAGLGAGAAAAGAEPVVDDVVAKIVEPADAGNGQLARFGSDARKPSLLMGVQI